MPRPTPSMRSRNVNIGIESLRLFETIINDARRITISFNNYYSPAISYFVSSVTIIWPFL